MSSKKVAVKKWPSQKEKESAWRSVLGYFHWKSLTSKMVFPLFAGGYAVIELSDLLKIIKFKKRV